MKELSIEQKAKAYDEALERAKKLQKTCDSQAVVGWCEYLFPELKKSDERIRKAIMKILNEIVVDTNYKELDIAYNIKDMIAWLKKQGEKPQGKTALEEWKDMRLEVYQQASGNRHEPNYSDDATKMFSLNDIDEIFEKIAEKREEKFHLKKN